MKTTIILATGIFLVIAAMAASPALAAASPSLSLNPGKGAPGASATVKGSGFASVETVKVSFDGSLAGKAETGKRGNFSLRFNVPKSMAPGVYPVRAVGETSGLSAQAGFTVKDPTGITLSPSSGPVDSAVAVNGTLFKKGETVDLYFDATLVAYALANSSTGAFAQDFIVPAGAAVDPHTVWAVGHTSGLTVQAAFTVTAPPAPAISLGSQAGPPTTQISVSGVNFDDDQRVEIYFDTVDLMPVSTSSSGSFTQNVVVPANAAPGQHSIIAVEPSSGLSAQAQFTVQTDWAQFGYGPRHGGYNPFENVLNASNASGLGEAWSFETGGQIWGSPAVANGVVYAGSQDGRLYAFDASTGKALWSNAATGEILYSSPAVASVAVGGVLTEVVYVGSNDNSLYAFNASTGSGVCSVVTTLPIYSSPAVVNTVVGDELAGVVYFGSETGVMYAIDAATCAVLWQYETGGAIISSPAVADGVVYVGSEEGNLYAFNASTGAVLWSFAPITSSVFNTTPAVADGVVYVGSYAGYLYALNADTGEQLWFTQTGSNSFSSPAVANGVVYVGTSDNNLLAIDASTGAELWRAATGGAIYSSPAVANGVVYVGSSDYNLYAYDLAGGESGF